MAPVLNALSSLRSRWFEIEARHVEVADGFVAGVVLDALPQGELSLAWKRSHSLEALMGVALIHLLQGDHPIPSLQADHVVLPEVQWALQAVLHLLSLRATPSILKYLFRWLCGSLDDILVPHGECICVCYSTCR